MIDVVRSLAKEVIDRYRLGFYHGKVVGAADRFRRHPLHPEWCDNPLTKVRRICSPILDVIPAFGARLAVLSQDGVPEFSAYVGQVSDDTHMPADMTVWLRADLQDHPGHVELGSARSIQLVVGDNTVDIAPQPDGTLLLEGDAIQFGSGIVERMLKSETFLTALRAAFDSHVHSDPISGTTGPPVVPWSAADPFVASLSTKCSNE